MDKFVKYLYPHQQEAIKNEQQYHKCLFNMWCGTGKTRVFTISMFTDNLNFNVIVFPSLGLINQYCNDYVLNQEEPFKTEFSKFNCLAFCSDDERKLKIKTKKIEYTTKKSVLKKFIEQLCNKLVVVTYQSFEKFINTCISADISINKLIYDEAHHLDGPKIQTIAFNNRELDSIVEKTRYYTCLLYTSPSPRD